MKMSTLTQRIFEREPSCCGLLLLYFSVAALSPVSAADPASLRAGAAREDITPPKGLPMWGYGARKDIPCQGVRDRLSATAVALEIGETRIAIVGLDLGRSPARSTLKVIREKVAASAGIDELFLVGSHTHHGPCVEVETLPPTSGYVTVLSERIVSSIVTAVKGMRPARVGVASREVEFNRNRHTKIRPKPVDPLLTVLRLEDTNGASIATLVNFAAHPTTLPATMLKWSADFPSPLRARVEEKLGGLCVYLQGACGDLSTNRRGLDTDQFGARLGDEVISMARDVTTASPKRSTLGVRAEEFRFGQRIRLDDPLTYAKYCIAFFPALVDAYKREYQGGIRPNITVALLGGEIGVVGASGEFFSQHAVRLRQRARLPHLLFLGYCNGYHQYFPTIEAVAEGGYGADPEVSPVEVGAGERMMDRALFHLFDMRKKIKVGP